jgi:DNA-binding response OmpR family regulator
MDKQTILIVEDDKKIVELIIATIEKIGTEYNIQIAYNGEEALKIIEKEKIDLALLDISMPVMSGAQLLTELSNRKIWFPIIIMTGYSVDDIRNNLFDYGVIDLLFKPLEILALREKVVETLLKRVRKDSFSVLSLSAIMQVLEMEQRTGVITVKTGASTGRIFFMNGKVLDIESDAASWEDAMVNFLDQSNDEYKEISIEYLLHKRKGKINKSLTEVVLEASRLLDEEGSAVKKNSNETYS